MNQHLPMPTLLTSPRWKTHELTFPADKYIESQLIMISPNRLAQYWVGFGHISFYERVNIDVFLSPYNDPAPRLSNEV